MTENPYTTPLGMVCCIAGVLALAVPATAVVDDNFDDNTQGTQWSLIEDTPAALSLSEANQQLEVLGSPGGSSTDDAIYLSNGASGFQLSTAGDFDMTIEYSFTNFAVPAQGTVALVFGIGEDLDGKNSAAIGFSRSTNILLEHALGAAYRVNDAQTNVPIGYPVGTSGTFRVTYTSATDSLALKETTTNLGATLPAGLVRGTWGASSVWVSFGARGDGLTINSGDAYLDNFTLVQGDVVPDPATISLVGVGLAGLMARRRSRRG